MEKPILPILNLRKRIEDGEIQLEESRSSLNLKIKPAENKEQALREPLKSTLALFSRESAAQSAPQQKGVTENAEQKDVISGLNLKEEREEVVSSSTEGAKSSTDALTVTSKYREEESRSVHPEVPDSTGVTATHPRTKDPLFKRGDHKRKGKFRIWSKVKSIFGFLFIFLITFFTIYFAFIQPSYIATQFDYYFGDNREFEKVENSLISLENKPELIEDIERGAVNKDEYILDDESPAIITPEEDFTRNRIVVPSLKIDAPIVTTRNSGVSDSDIEEALHRGVLHYPGMANPGEVGNVFMTGHSSNYWWDEGDYNNVFATLIHAKEGERIIVYFNQKKYVYRITDKFEVGPNDTWVLKQNPREAEKPESVLSLMTCTPPGTNLRRLIVWAEEDPEFMQVTEGEYTDSGVPGTDRLISPL